jgi:hypothetical protein
MVGMDGARCKMHKCDVLVVIDEYVAVRAALCEKPFSLQLLSFVDFKTGSRNLVKCWILLSFEDKSPSTQNDHHVHKWVYTQTIFAKIY